MSHVQQRCAHEAFKCTGRPRRRLEQLLPGAAELRRDELLRQRLRDVGVVSLGAAFQSSKRAVWTAPVSEVAALP